MIYHGKKISCTKKIMLEGDACRLQDAGVVFWKNLNDKSSYLSVIGQTVARSNINFVKNNRYEANNYPFRFSNPG